MLLPRAYILIVLMKNFILCLCYRHITMMDEQPAEFFAKLAERLRKVRLNREFSGKCSPKLFKHYDMILNMLAKARDYERDFIGDVCRLVGIYYCYGSNNTERILREFEGSPELKQRFIDMIEVYEIVDGVLHHQANPTLSRIVAGFPHISLVLAGEINASPALELKLLVSDKDLGARVHYLFKLSCFPSMIRVDSGIKAQACLLLFTLCYAKATSNMHQVNKSIISAFIHACYFTTEMIEERLVPFESRLRFTKHVEEMAPGPELLYRVWTSVFGDQQVPLTEATAVTLLHEKVLLSQPMNLASWKKVISRW